MKRAGLNFTAMLCIVMAARKNPASGNQCQSPCVGISYCVPVLVNPNTGDILLSKTLFARYKISLLSTFYNSIDDNVNFFATFAAILCETPLHWWIAWKLSFML